MNKWKKALSVGMSAALLASLFTVIAASTALAAVTSISPVQGPIAGGQSVTITGSGFDGTSAANLGGSAVAITSLSPTSIVGTTSAHTAGVVSAVVTGGGAATLATAYSYTNMTVTSVSPAVGTAAGGTTVTITGTNFNPSSTATFGGTAATFVSGSATQLVFASPAHLAGAVAIVITDSVSTATFTIAAGFTYYSGVTVTSVTPATGSTAGGTSVTIAGTNFFDGASVTFGGTAATSIVVVSTTSITALTPAHTLGAVTVVVTNTDAQTGSLASGFTYDTPPTVTSVSPNSGPAAGGTVVTITGTLFVSGATVTFGGSVASVGFVSSTTLLATTSAHVAGAVNVVVTNPDAASGTLVGGFTYVGTSTGIASGGTVTVQAAASVPRGDSYAPAAAPFTSLTFTEGAIADFGTGFSFIINIAPATPGAGSVSFDTTKTIAVGAPDSLALTAKFLNAQQILVTSAPTVTGVTDNLKIEVFSIGGLQIKAAAGTTLGAIATTISGSTGSIADAYWAGSTALATGLLQNNYSAGAGPVSIKQTSTCGFGLTGTPASNGTLNFASNPESVNITASPGSHVLNDIYSLTIGSMTLSHGSGTSVSQTVVNCAPSGTIPSVGTVVDALLLTATTTPGVQAGLNNQPAGNVVIAEQSLGFIPASTVCTLSVSEPGVLFSAAASVADNTDMTLSSVADLSLDRTSLTFTVTGASTTGPSTITVSGIKYDVAATAKLGDAVMVKVTCGALLIAPTSVENAFVNNAIVQVAAAPTVFIGYNDQQSGMLSVTESQPGFFGSLGGGNTFTVCLTLADGATFTRVPWAVVSTGDLKLLNSSSGTGASQLAGTLSSNFLCATWTVYSASTVASTIDIRGTDASGVVLAAGPNNGPRYNIASSAAPGPVHLSLTGSSTTGSTSFGTQVNAIKAFKNGVAVAAVSQPFVAPGGLNQPAGNLTISETLNGQFVTGEQIECQVLNSAFNRNNQVFLSTAISNDLPVVSTNTSTGLIAHLASTSTTSNSFLLMVDQPAFAPGLGVITISNLHYTVVSDAVLGPVFVECSNKLSTGAGFDAFVSNAIVGTRAIGLGLAATRLGVTQVGAFTISTKIAKTHKYVTYRFDFGVAGAGQIVQIWGATKTGNDWSAFTVVTSRRANASGVVYYYIRQNSATWKSYRANWSANNAWTPARQARWIP